MKRVLVPLADGFEEIEALTVVDLLRRAGVETTTAGVAGRLVEGSHGIAVQADVLLDEVVAESFDMVVLPGGLPGSQTLRSDVRVQALVKRMAGEGRWLAAICAAPMALAEAGLLDGKAVTCFPGALNDFPGLASTGATVERDGLLVTGKGPGAAMDFALALIEALAGRTKRDEVESKLQRPPRAA